MSTSARWRAVSIGLLLAAVTSPAAQRDPNPGHNAMFRARTLIYPYETGAIFALPHEKIPLGVVTPSTQLFALEAHEGALLALDRNRWIWEAPGEKGRYRITARNPAGGDVAEFNAFVMVPAALVRNGFLNGYQIGQYRPARSTTILHTSPPAGSSK